MRDLFEAVSKSKIGIGIINDIEFDCQSLFYSKNQDTINISEWRNTIKDFFVLEIKRFQVNDDTAIARHDRYLSLLAYCAFEYINDKQGQENDPISLLTVYADFEAIMSKAQIAMEITLKPGLYLGSTLVHKAFHGSFISCLGGEITHILTEDELKNINANIPRKEREFLENFYNKLPKSAKKNFSVQYTNSTPDQITEFVEKLNEKAAGSKIKFAFDQKAGNNMVQVDLSNARADNKIEALDIIYKYCFEYAKAQQMVR